MPVVVRQSMDKRHREVLVILRESVTEVSQHTLATLCVAKGVREMSDPTTSLPFRIRYPPSRHHKASLGLHWTEGFSQWGKKTMSDIYKTMLSAATASREKQSWRNSNIPHDLHKGERKGEKMVGWFWGSHWGKTRNTIIENVCFHKLFCIEW